MSYYIRATSENFDTFINHNFFLSTNKPALSALKVFPYGLGLTFKPEKYPGIADEDTAKLMVDELNNTEIYKDKVFFVLDDPAKAKENQSLTVFNQSTDSNAVQQENETQIDDSNNPAVLETPENKTDVVQADASSDLLTPSQTSVNGPTIDSDSQVVQDVIPTPETPIDAPQNAVDVKTVLDSHCNISESVPLPQAAARYIELGFRVTPLRPGTKAAYVTGWNVPNSPAITEKHWDNNPSDNIGCILEPSGIVTVDIDAKQSFVEALEAISLPQTEIPFTQVPTSLIVSGRVGKGKIVFKVPTPEQFEAMGFSKDTKLEFHKLNWRNPDVNAKQKQYTVFELRCGYVQDVLPPSIHPDTKKPYHWAGAETIAVMPKDLVYLWLHWDKYELAMRQKDPNYIEDKPVERGRPRKENNGRDYIAEWVSNQDIRDWLRVMGYVEYGDRFLSPSSTSGSPGIIINEGACQTIYSFGESDTFADGYPHDAFDLMAAHKFNGDKTAAFKFVLEELGVHALNTPEQLKAYEHLTGHALTKETTARNAITEMRKALQDKISNKTCTEEDKEVYLKTIQARWYADHEPIDKNCANIPPWNRSPNQILHDITNTELYTCNDIGRYMRFIEEVHGFVRYSEKMKSFLIWTGTHWTTEDANANVNSIITNMHYSLQYEKPQYTYIDDKGNEVVKPEYNIMLKESGKDSGAYAVFRLASRNNSKIKCETFNPVTSYIPFANGMYDTVTHELKPHDPLNYNTVVGAVDLVRDCPDFAPGIKFFDEISCHRPEWTEKVLQILGRCMMHGNKDQLFYAFIGKGGNGKGVLLEWLAKAFGELVSSISADELSKFNRDQRQTSLVDELPTRRIIIAQETGKIELDDEIIQLISGNANDPNGYYLKRIHTGMQKIVEPPASLILVSNNQPTFSKGGESMNRRTVCVPFDMELDDSQRDNDLLSKLNTLEGNRWLVWQVIKHLEISLQNERPFKTTMPPCIAERTAAMIKNADNVLDWLMECCEFGTGPEFRMSRNLAYKSFCGYTYSIHDGKDPTDSKFWMKPKTFMERLGNEKGIRILNKQTRLPDDKRCRADDECDKCHNTIEGIRLNDNGLKVLINSVQL